MSKPNGLTTLHFLHFLHFRHMDNGEVTTKGGKTIGYEVVDGRLRYAVALCSEKESFCRRVGRIVAVRRFYRGGPVVVENFDATKESPISYLYKNEGKGYFERTFEV